MNKIMQENAIVEGRADMSYWDVSHSTEIEGFATDMSVNAGTRVDFKINVNGGAGSDYMVEIFRLGYYGGSGAREVAEWTNTNATVQPDALVDASRGMVDAGNWSVTDGWNVPADAVSGVYLARLQRLDSNGDPIDGAVNQIPFVVRNDGESPRHRPADLRHDVAGLQCLGRQQRRGRCQSLRRQERQHQLGSDRRGPATSRRIAPTPSATIAPSLPATAPARSRAHRTICSAPTMRPSTGSRSRDTTSPTSRASTPIGSAPTTSRTTSRSSRSVMTNTGRATSARTSRKPAIPA